MPFCQVCHDCYLCAQKDRSIVEGSGVGSIAWACLVYAKAVECMSSAVCLVGELVMHSWA